MARQPSQEILAGFEGFDIEGLELQQDPKGIPDGLVVVDDTDCPARATHESHQFLRRSDRIQFGDALI